jgi:hypothetical protein
MFTPLPKPEKRGPKPPKPISRYGKKARSYKKFRDKELLPTANHQGYFICERCKRWTDRIAMNHKNKRSTHPQQVFDKKNVERICFDCDIAQNNDYNLQ